MRYVVFVALATVLLAAGWLAGSGSAISAQTAGEPARDCHFTLFGDRYMSTRTIDRPDVFRIDECTGDTWVLDRSSWEWARVR